MHYIRCWEFTGVKQAKQVLLSCSVSISTLLLQGKGKGQRQDFSLKFSHSSYPALNQIAEVRESNPRSGSSYSCIYHVAIRVTSFSMASSPPPLPRSLAHLRASFPSYLSKTNAHISHIERSTAKAHPTRVWHNTDRTQTLLSHLYARPNAPYPILYPPPPTLHPRQNSAPLCISANDGPDASYGHL